MKLAGPAFLLLIASLTATTAPAPAGTFAVEGILVDVFTGKPVAERKVGLRAGSTQGPTAQSDAAGHFLIRGIPSDSGFLFLALEDRSGSLVHVSRPNGGLIDVDPKFARAGALKLGTLEIAADFLASEAFSSICDGERPPEPSVPFLVFFQNPATKAWRHANDTRNQLAGAWSAPWKGAVCIDPSSDVVGHYVEPGREARSDDPVARAATWNVRVVSWPEGRVFPGQFIGGAPRTNYRGLSSTGDPTPEVADWLKGNPFTLLTVAGTLVDIFTQEPVAGKKLRIGGQVVVTAADGRFVAEGVQKPPPSRLLEIQPETARGFIGLRNPIYIDFKGGEVRRDLGNIVRDFGEIGRLFGPVCDGGRASVQPKQGVILFTSEKSSWTHFAAATVALNEKPWPHPWKGIVCMRKKDEYTWETQLVRLTDGKVFKKNLQVVALDTSRDKIDVTSLHELPRWLAQSR